ncbi:hypothetical protein RchiOBHm_Chr4g0429561 [Rosa chinensis]|uniref:Pollen allergen Ole e 1 family n=1 Tax=Rosa chinensis TaxID=74649 RepID=A0A2P6R071_ROSCH|nr:formin-1 [Rosa chinensis]PRQ39834.1 hypothetical protein RchiOBHm_Chr4g0429561 [Rosa chinensis]
MHSMEYHICFGRSCFRTFPMDAIIFHLLLLLTCFLTHPIAPVAHKATTPTARITVVGAVYCDTCSSNTFSRSSYFLPGVDVVIQCKFRGNSAKASEDMNFSVNKTTNKYGVYKLEIPSVDGVNCLSGVSIKSMCQASLIWSSSKSCNVPGLRTTADEISVKSKQDNLCIYSMNALSYRPPKKNLTLCGKRKEEESASSFNSSKFFLPYFPPFYQFPWPPLPQFPFPPLPPLPSLPPFPSFPFPPSLPFPFPSLPPFPSPNPLAPNTPPPFNLGDPRTWIPYIPSVFPPPPPPPGFNLRDPRTWIPYIPPSPPNRPQNQNP